MELPSIFPFQGWNIQYNLLKSPNPSPQDQPVKSIVFVHGTPWSSVVFRSIIETLLSKPPYHILVYDLPGYGKSQSFTPSPSSKQIPEGDFQGDTSVGFQAQALTALLEHVKLDGKNGNPTPAVVAHDIAGTIVLRTHLIHNIDLEGMMLVDANAVLPWGDGFYKLCREDPTTFLRLPQGIFDAMVRAVIKSAVHDPNVLQTGCEEELAHPWSGVEGQKSFVRQIAQANDGDVAEMLEGDMYGSVRCDVKIVWGEEDQWIPREKVEKFRGKVGGRVKEFVVIPKAGHLVMLDQPGRFAVEVWEWLMRPGGSAP